MKLPQLPIRKSKDTSAGASSLQLPAFVSDLFKDMRDRRLVAPAIALLVAIIAVPLLLSSSPSPAVPPAPLAADPDAAAVEPGVLAVQEVGVRDYRKRLDALDRKNPFGDRFESQGPTTTAEGSALVPADEGEPVATSPAPEAVGSPVDSGVSATSSSPGHDAAPPPAPGTDEERYVIVPRIDAEVGIMGRDRRQTIERVRSGDLLPSKQSPVAMFLGNRDDGSVAELLVSRDVSRVNGEGECKPGPNNCEFLRMEDGDSAYLRYADGKRYVITVKDIYFARIPASEVENGEKGD